MSFSQDILIIEDDAATVDFMTEALKEDGYAVRSAPDGEQGLSEIKRLPPALILLDLHMPGITAIEFLERLQAIDGPQFPIVIMTADKNARAHLSIQCDLTYLFKPFDLDELLAYVAQFVQPRLQREQCTHVLGC